MVVAMISSNTLQFQNFWDFNKCLQAIFTQLSFVFQNVKTVQQRKPNLNFIRVIKKSSFNQSFV